MDTTDTEKLNKEKLYISQQMAKIFGLPVATQRLIGKVLITIFFSYLAFAVLSVNSLVAAAIFIFGIWLAWLGD